MIATATWLRTEVQKLDLYRRDVQDAHMSVGTMVGRDQVALLLVVDVVVLLRHV